MAKKLRVSPGDELAELRAQRRIHVVVHRQDVVLLRGTPCTCVTASFARRCTPRRSRSRGMRRQRAVALLLQLAASVCARASSRFEQRDLVLPRHRHEVHVAQAPGVVLLADAGRAGLRRRLRARASARSPPSPRAPRSIARLQLRAAVRAFCSSASRSAILLSDRADAGDPEVARIAGQVHARLREQRRQRSQLAPSSFFSSAASSGNA